MKKPTIASTIGVKLKWLRNTFEYSQEELAHYLDVPRPSISMLEQDKRELSAWELLRLSDLFCIDMRYFLVADLKGIKAQYKVNLIEVGLHKHYLPINPSSC